MKKIIQAIRGMNDILPEEIVIWQQVEDKLKQIVEAYGYQEIRTPIVESTELFQRSVGEVTDIVEKEMYTFDDQSGDSLTLRPEGTAGCVRAGIEHGFFHNQLQRLWYTGPIFRHERPQKGRYRQFYQFGVEVFGIPGPDIDAEMIMMTARMWEAFGFLDKVILQLNSLGNATSRQRYHQQLVDYFSKYETSLDEDSRRRLRTNPLRILDSKNPEMQSLIQGAPKLLDVIDDESKTHFAEMCALLDKAGIRYEVNPCLVRGLDYYTLTVFEWITDCLGAQGTVCAGGRFDGLVEQMGGKATPAIGFAMGLERLIALLSVFHLTPDINNHPDIYFVLMGKAAEAQGLLLAEQIRTKIPEIKVLSNCGGGSFKSQFKRADKSGAMLALILGDAEMDAKACGVKFLREEKEQETVAFDQLISFLKQHCL